MVVALPAVAMLAVTLTVVLAPAAPDDRMLETDPYDVLLTEEELPEWDLIRKSRSLPSPQWNQTRTASAAFTNYSGHADHALLDITLCQFSTVHNATAYYDGWRSFYDQHYGSGLYADYDVARTTPGVGSSSTLWVVNSLYNVSDHATMVFTYRNAMCLLHVMCPTREADIGDMATEITRLQVEKINEYLG